MGGDYFKNFCLRGRLFEVGDYLRDGYYSRKYGMRCLFFFKMRYIVVYARTFPPTSH